ncbi:OmpH family outer membrane protein [Celerinatantimonas sp. YJH-8]|uniref:OmpH family outer membrane protein n=1 Tax=Celerinatantimonas sp. YJH-8 TaxID=3228714 RepID=UPI0038C2E60B
MKKLIQTAFLSAALMAPTAAVMADTSIATIDMRVIFQQLPQREAAMKKLQDEFAGRIKELKALESKINDLYQKREKDQALMSDDDKTKLNRQIEAMQTEFQLKRKNFQDDHRQETEKEQQKLLAKIQSAVSTIAKQKHYDLVLPIDATAYAKPSLDISKEVINEISKQK